MTPRRVTFPRRALLMAAALAALFTASCAPSGPTAEDAAAFIDAAEAEILQAWIASETADWQNATDIRDEHQAAAAAAKQAEIELTIRKVAESKAYDGLELPADVARRLELLELSLIPLPAPSNPEETAELTQIAAAMESTYGAGEYCREDGECLDLGELSTIIETSRDPEALLDAWRGWRTVSVPIRKPYERYVELANKGARELGYTDLGALWRSNYDMDPDAFAAELDRLWDQMRPFYEALHCHVRARLAEQYGEAVVDPAGPIPAHLLGNMWSQSWANVYDLVKPEGGGDAGYDLTELLLAKGVDEREMVRYGERFFTSLGFAPLPETFWERSLFVKPEDRDVVCHASAWDIDQEDDLRIKMCIEIDAEDFQTIHHELGHNFYQRAYSHLPPLYRDSANDGFHEAVGDAVALSVTPSYLVQVGLLEAEPDSSADLGFLLRAALDKIAFIPFGLLVDQWRWKVYSGEIGADAYNQGWWDLRLAYQGIAPPVERSEADFDPGAKYHVPANVPYTRYFLAHILQFQFHRALCAAAGYEGDLHRCSIYESAAAGEKLAAMLEMGRSRPWQDALEALTGSREMDATAVRDYFAPLEAWLEEQNAGRACGW